MVAFPVWALIPLLIIATAGVLAMLHSLASSIRNDRYVHDLMVEATDLRTNYIRRLRRIADEAGVEVDTVSDVEVIG